MKSKMFVLIVIIQPYQNERLKAYSTLLDMLFISFIKDTNFKKGECESILSAMDINFITLYIVDSENTQLSVTARDRGGLWKVNEFVGTI